MLWYFLQKKVQPHLNFLVNLVDVRDVAMGLVLTMERGRIGQRPSGAIEHHALSSRAS
jgi:dihydroflavonol-4-reductase